MSRASVAIVGRANVGKSSLFNALIGRRQAIVDSVPGVTRDRIFARTEWYGKEFDLIDTGGFEPFMQEGYLPLIRAQAELAIEEADVIIFLCDVKAGVTAADLEISQLLRKSQKPVVVAVNKLEKPDDEFYSFYELGLGEIYPISALHRQGLAELMTEVIELLPERGEHVDFAGIKLALIGKPNVGKSTLFNFLLNDERAIVSDQAGTTRDALTERFTYDGDEYAVIDTAGLRRKARVADQVEKYSAMRSATAVEDCDVALIMIDGTEGVTEQDTKVAGRDLETAANEGNPRAKLALEMFAYSVRKDIGAYSAAMGGLDAVVFTAGIGENDCGVRELVLKDLADLGIELDCEKNATIRGKECEISTPESQVKVFVIPTNEELAIARDTAELAQK